MEIELASLGRAFLYLGVPFIFMVFYSQWKWARTCERNIQVLVAQRGGGGKFSLAPKSGGEVSITNPVTGEARTWPINELATIDVPYPGLGFLPKFLQKTIRMTIVNEGDWEPVLNRSPHKTKIASPDVVDFILDVAVHSEDKMRKEIANFMKGISTGPTREMIADPATLGALRQSTIMKALATVSDDLVESIKKLQSQLSRIAGINPTVIYIGLFLIGALIAFNVYQTMQLNLVEMSNKISAIYQSLGIQP